MKRTLVVVVPLLAILLLLAGAWQLFSGNDDKGAAAPQLHGTASYAVLAPFARVGKLGRQAKDTSDGAQLAADELNAAGGVLGRKVVLTPIDDACSPVTAYEAAKGIGEGSGFTGVLGGICDNAAAREVGVIAASGIPFLVTTANGPHTVSPGDASAYLMNGTLYQQALSATFWMNYRSAQRLAIVGDNSRESQQLNKQVIELIDEAPKLVSLQKAPVGSTDMATIARAAVAANPNFVYWTGGPAGGGALARELHALGYKGAFVASAASEDPVFLKEAGTAGDGAQVLATSTPANTPLAAKWRQAFRRKYGREPGLEALQAYDSLRTLAQATKQAGSIDPAKVVPQLEHIDEKLTTFLGVVRFAADHTLLYDNRVILEVKDGKFDWKRSLRTDSLQ